MEGNPPPSVGTYPFHYRATIHRPWFMYGVDKLTLFVEAPSFSIRNTNAKCQLHQSMSETSAG